MSNGREHCRVQTVSCPQRPILSSSDLLRRCARLCGARFPKDKFLDRDGVLTDGRGMAEARQGWVKSPHRDRPWWLDREARARVAHAKSARHHLLSEGYPAAL